MKKSIGEYKAAINKAASKDELTAISYEALKNDPECTVFSRKYEKIIELCIQREEDLIRTQEPEKKPTLSERIKAAENQQQRQTAPAGSTFKTLR